MNNPNEILCYEQYRLSKFNGVFDPSMKKLIMPATPMTRKAAEDYNAVTMESGILFVENAEETAKFKEYQKERKANALAQKSIKADGAKELLGHLINEAVAVTKEKKGRAK